VRVRLLDPHVVNQIAAGEVVERPASVVKELVENALDAGARRIEVELRDAGRRLIRVADDGCGMALEDALAALRRHATSKIRRLEDLSLGATLGFRGEALPSIASVSRLTLATGLGDGVRWTIPVDGGQVGEPVAGGGPRGAEVSVEDLFFNTPARLKFLKTDATEMAQIVETLSKYAVAYPHVAFRLVHGGAALLAAPGDGSVRTAVLEVWGRDALRALVELDSWVGGVRVRGFVSPPHATRATRSHQWMYVNGRPVRSRTLTAALDQAYRSLTPEKRFPMAILMLDVDPARVDANVSPTKSEVKFAREGEAFDAVRHAVRSALLEQGMIPDAEGLAAANRALAQARAASPPGAVAEFREALAAASGLSGRFSGGGEGPEAADAGAFGVPPEGGRPAGAFLGAAGAGGADAAESERPHQHRAGTAGAPAAGGYGSMLQGLRVIGQMAGAFILAENDQGLLIVDQHVAHERILFEAIREARSLAPVERQALLEPVALHLDKRAAALLAAQIEEVRALGFDVEPFGAGTFLLRGAPAALRRKDPARFLTDLVEELASGAAGPAGPSPAREAIWIACACKAAVKAGDPLSIAEMEKLLTDLAQTENPYLCPHGRPITIVLGRDALMRQFKRS
jgi:DNA mismatch repair protein MutL